MTEVISLDRSGGPPAFPLPARGGWDTSLRLVDVELVPLGIGHGHPIVIKPGLGEHPRHRRAEAHKPLHLGVDTRRAGLDRDRPVAAGGDVEVQPVLHRLALRHPLEPDARAGAVWINDAVLADVEVFLADSEVAVIVVPAVEALRGRLEVVVQCRGPEPGEPVRVRTIDHQLETDHALLAFR